LRNPVDYIGENKVNSIGPVVVAEGKFVHISLKMFSAHLVVNSVIAPLEQGPKALGSVGMDIALADIFSPTMTDNLMGIESAEPPIGKKIIRVKVCSKFYLIDDLAFKRHAAHIVNNCAPHFPAPLKEANNGGLGEGVPALCSLRALGSVFVLLLPAYVGLVHFNSSEQLTVVLLEGMTDSVIHEPRCLLSNAHLLSKLDGRNALFVDGKKINRGEPLLQGDFALTKDSSGFDGEVLFALGATIPLAVLKAVDFSMSAMRTIGTLAKTEGLKILAASVLVLEEFMKLGHGLKLEFFHV
jgi:hypothetical protein